MFVYIQTHTHTHAGTTHAYALTHSLKPQSVAFSGIYEVHHSAGSGPVAEDHHLRV